MTSIGEDGSVDHHGEALPTLTKASSKVRLDALMSVPQPRWDRAIPGSPFWTKLAFVLLRIVARGQFKSMTSEGLERLDHDRGAMCCAWHVNALMDPLAIMLTHPSHFVIGGRHDLVTRPILSFWTRRMAVQPVVRKAELLRGGFSKEEAQNLNGRPCSTSRVVSRTVTVLPCSPRVRPTTKPTQSASEPGRCERSSRLLPSPTSKGGLFRTSYRSACTSGCDTISAPMLTSNTANQFRWNWTTSPKICWPL